MYSGQGNLFSSNQFDLSKQVQGFDIYSSLFIYNADLDRVNLEPNVKKSVHVRSDIFSRDVSKSFSHEGAILVINRIHEWEEIEAGEFLLVPSTSQIRRYTNE